MDSLRQWRLDVTTLLVRDIPTADWKLNLTPNELATMIVCAN